MLNDLARLKQDEWLETDGLGGFASGTVSGIRTRRYHALLLTATKPPAGRLVLVNGFDAAVETANRSSALSSQHYPPDIIHPDGACRIAEFTSEPWPRWIFALVDGTKIEQELFVVNGASIVAISWRLLDASAKATLTVRPFLSGRDYHSMHHENPAFQFHPEINDKQLIWRPYPGIPGIVALHNGAYQHQPEWYRYFVYEQERERGLDFTEDLAAPGSFRWELTSDAAILLFAAAGLCNGQLPAERSAKELFSKLRASENQRRQKFLTPLHRAADSYLVKRGSGKTLVAGYPWFTDWGRDTFISLRGLCLATERLGTARDILLEWSKVVSEGMLPNLFSDQSDRPEYNSVDASLWYIVAVHDFLAATQNNRGMVLQWQKNSMQKAIDAILTGYSQGTRFGIRMDQDGLLAAGVPGVQLTWMDAKVGDWVVTPRIGKPVEIQALWLNALWIASQFNDRWKEPLARGRESFRRRFWHEAGSYLYDVVDADHQPGKLDPSFRPNQIFAVGGLPLALLDGERAKRIVDAVERRLWTPLGLRSLAPDDSNYTPRYQGGVRERDGAYHQGIVWPWLIGPFVEAWLRVNGGDEVAKRTARVRFVTPLFEHLQHAGLGQVSEIADAEPPHTPRGCPFQAWSLAELLRLDRVVLAENETENFSHRIGLK
ncbi:MAG: Amylo-alpha-16-glucosidase [Deltaproteobacteria bacterium]|nr:Amylo-alpha-16-glucosidase [Deltaproteobacteria bacterium]